MDKEKFLEGVTDWFNHLPLLWLALEETKQGEVLEMGCGDGSTRQLHEYCKDAGRKLYSFDTDREWIARFADCKSPEHEFKYIENNWHITQDICPNPSVILSDNAPGERRVVDIKNYSDKINGIIVIHDSQPPPTAADYGFERIWSLFKYKVDLKVTPNPAPPYHNRTWATAVSNTHDVTKWIGQPTNNPDYAITEFRR